MTRQYRNYQHARRSPFHMEDLFMWGIGILVVLGIVVTGITVVSYQTTSDTMTCTVTEKDRTTKSDGGSDMRVYTEDCGVLVVGDNIFRGVWNSADIYSGIEAGQTYTFDTFGYRLPLFSLFPTIQTVK